MSRYGEIVRRGYLARIRREATGRCILARIEQRERRPMNPIPPEIERLNAEAQEQKAQGNRDGFWRKRREYLLAQARLREENNPRNKSGTEREPVV